MPQGSSAVRPTNGLYLYLLQHGMIYILTTERKRQRPGIFLGGQRKAAKYFCLDSRTNGPRFEPSKSLQRYRCTDAFILPFMSNPCTSRSYCDSQNLEDSSLLRCYPV